MPQSASPPQTRFEVFYARLSLELPDTRKSRQIGLGKRLNGNRKVRTVAETLSYTWSPSAANRDNPKREDPHPPPGGGTWATSSVPAGNGPKSPFLAHRRGGRAFCWRSCCRASNRPDNTPLLQFAASAILAFEPCFGCTTAFLFGQPPHRRPLIASGTKRQRFIGGRNTACFRRQNVFLLFQCLLLL